MNNICKIFIAGATVTAFCGNSYAQTQKDSTLHQSMTIERNFSPIVRDANKIDQQPAIFEVKVKKSPTRYADWMAGEAQSPEISRARVGQVIAEEDPYKSGFIEVSAGNYVNGDIKAELRLTDEFSIEADGYLFKGDLDLPEESVYDDIITETPAGSTTQLINRDDIKWDSRFLNGNIKLNYHHAFTNDSRLRAYVLAGGRNYNMLTFSHKEKQRLGRVWGWVNYEKDSWFVDVLAKHTTLDIPDVADNCVNLKGGYGIYYEDDWQLKMALDLGLEFGEKNPFTFYPEVEFSKFLDESRSRFYVHAGGGIVKPDLYELMTVMPLLLPNEYENEKDLLNATFGYEDNNRGDFKWGVFAGARYTLNRLDGLMCNLLIFPSDDKIRNEVNDKVGQIYHGELTREDEFEFKAGAYFDYERNKLFGSKGALNFTTNPHFGAPMLNMNLHLLSNPVNKLSLDLGFDCGIKREMDFFFPAGEIESIDLGNIVDLNLRADFQLLPNLNIFLFGKNLLNQEYQLWAGVPAQGINIHAGFNWRF